MADSSGVRSVNVANAVPSLENSSPLSGAMIHGSDADLTGRQCCACSGSLNDRYVLRVSGSNDAWHSGCLRCHQCENVLDETSTCYVKCNDDQGRTKVIYCKNDYLRLFSRKCDRCGLCFQKSDLVMTVCCPPLLPHLPHRHRHHRRHHHHHHRVDQKPQLQQQEQKFIYHVDCFRCSACDRHLVTGDEYGLVSTGSAFPSGQNFMLLCRSDLDQERRMRTGRKEREPDEQENDEKSQTDCDDDDDDDNDKKDISVATNDDDDCYNNNDNDVKPILVSEGYNGANLARNRSDAIVVTCNNNNNNGGNKHVNGNSTRGSGNLRNSGSGKPVDQKTTRVRTVLNEKQLHTLRTCYAANPRPDALMKEQLVEMTGLSSRVIRVWFQNKRCKDKKRSILIKQIQQQQQQQHQQDSAVSLVAASPIRHDSSLGMVPVPVHQYQLPWTRFGDVESNGYISPPSYVLNPGSGDLGMKMGEQPAFQKLINTFGGISDDDEDDTVVSMEEPCARINPQQQGQQQQQQQQQMQHHHQLSNFFRPPSTHRNSPALTYSSVRC